MKKIATNKILETLRNNSGIATLYSNYKFIMLSNYFAQKGLKITLQNKEDVLLQIISASDNDSELINNLEEYLVVYDNNVTLDQFWCEKYTSFLKSVNEATSNDEIKNHVDIFLSYFR